MAPTTVPASSRSAAAGLASSAATGAAAAGSGGGSVRRAAGAAWPWLWPVSWPSARCGRFGSSSKLASTEPVGMMSPAPPDSFSTLPENGEGTSTTALAVSIETSGSSSLITSPSLTNHSTMVASGRPSPRSGRLKFLVWLICSSLPAVPVRGPAANPSRHWRARTTTTRRVRDEASPSRRFPHPARGRRSRTGLRRDPRPAAATRRWAPIQRAHRWCVPRQTPAIPRHGHLLRRSGRCGTGAGWDTGCGKPQKAGPHVSRPPPRAWPQPRSARRSAGTSFPGGTAECGCRSQ